MFCLFAVFFVVVFYASWVILDVNMWRPQAANCGAQRGAAWLPNQAAQRAPNNISCFLTLFTRIRSAPSRAERSRAEASQSWGA